MSQTNDILLFEELMRLPRHLRHSMMKQEHPEEPHERSGRLMKELRPPFHPGHHPHHGNRPFARERVLENLLSYENGARQKELAESMHINPSSISELIDKLHSDGYIERTIDPDDKRATRVILTELGKARAYELLDERSERIQPLFSSLSEEEKAELLRLIRKLNTPDN